MEPKVWETCGAEIYCITGLLKFMCGYINCKLALILCSGQDGPIVKC